MKTIVKKSKKEDERNQREEENEAARVSTSAAPERGKSISSIRENIPQNVEGEVMSTPTTIGANIAQGEDAGTSPHLTDAA